MQVDRPVTISMPDSFGGYEDQVILLPNVFLSVVDQYPGTVAVPLTVVLTTRVGVLTFTPNANVVSVVTTSAIVPGLTGVLSSNITLTGTLANINTVLSTLQYQGNPNSNDFSSGVEIFNLTCSYPPQAPGAVWPVYSSMVCAAHIHV